MVKGSGSILEGAFRVFRDIASRLIFDLLLTCRLSDVSLVIFHVRLAYSVLLKYFLVVSYLINSLFKRKVYKS